MLKLEIKDGSWETDGKALY